jgi:TonB family protein
MGRGKNIMSKFAAALCLALAACATGGAVRVDREAAAGPQVALVADAATARAFPRANNPQLPSADRISRRIRDEVGDVASAQVRLCVGSDGRVQRVDVLRSSRLAAFDDAVVHDMSDWQFSGIPGSGAAARPQNCEIAKISYRVHL